MSLDLNSEAVLKTIDIQQAAIARMSAASAAAKNWCVTLLTAVAVVAIDKSKPSVAWFAVFPTVLFLSVDIYYLALEKQFRDVHKKFVDSLRDGTATADALFCVGVRTVDFKSSCEAARSKSIWPVYLLTLVAICVLAAISSP